MSHPIQLEYEAKKTWRERLRTGLLRLVHVVTSKRYVICLLTTVTVLVSGGYASNRVSLARFERRTAISIARNELGRRLFHLNAYGEADSRAIFTAAGIQSLSSAGAGEDRLPCAGISRGHSVFPFIVEVEYGCSFGRLNGHGGIRRYFCLFGFVVQTEDPMTWIS